MKILGLEILSAAVAQKLREDNADIAYLERQLEDIGWININNPNQGLLGLTRESYNKMVLRCRLAYIKSPIVAQGVDLTTYYVFGDGVTAPKAKATDVQEIISDFWTDTDNLLSLTSPISQLKLSNKLQYDGEVAIVMPVDVDGSVYARIMDPLTIADVIYDKKDGMRPIFYKCGGSGYGTNNVFYIPDCKNAIAVLRDEYPVEWQEMLKSNNIKEGEVMTNTYLYHLKVNNDILDKRGIPYVYRALEYMQSNSKINNDMASFINQQAQYAWKKKIKGTKSQIDAMKARQGQNTTLTSPSFQAGSMLIENQLVDNMPIGLPNSSGQLFEIGIRRTLLMMCSAFGIMEHYFGDPSTGNLATATAMELPMLKKFMAIRKLWEGVYDDILNFQLDMKLMYTNKNAFILNPVKNRYVRTSDYPDRYFDVDFPPILQTDLKALSDSLIAAKNGQLIPIETAQRMYMAAAGINNIDEEMKKEFAEPAPMFTGFGGKPIPKAAPVKESATVPASVIAERKKAMKLAERNKATIAGVNAYLREIAVAYNKFSSRIHRAAVIEGVTDPKDPEAKRRISLHIRESKPIVNAFILEMKYLAHKYFPRAIAIGQKYAEFHAPVKVSEASFDPSTFQADQLSWNQDFLETSLAPALDQSMTELDGQQFVDESAAQSAIDDSVAAFETRVGSYASAFWTVEERAVKEASAGSGQEANFIGVEDKENCDGCSEAIAGNPYPVDDCPVPGEQDCMGNCRHAIQLSGDEEPFTESDRAVLREMQTTAKKGFKLL